MTSRVTTDAVDESLRAHDREDVADVRKYDREVDDTERHRGADAPHRHIADLDLATDQERVEDRRQREAQDDGVQRVGGEEPDDARRVARGGHLDAEDDDQDDDAEGDALGAADHAEDAGGGGWVRGEEVADRAVVGGVEEAENDHEHRGDGHEGESRKCGADPARGGLKVTNGREA